jgi:hypothetical protein
MLDPASSPPARRKFLVRSAGTGAAGAHAAQTWSDAAASASGAVAPVDAHLRAFRISISDSALAYLRRRPSATRWPNRETASDASQDVYFAAWDQPRLFAEEFRACFKSLRNA